MDISPLPRTDGTLRSRMRTRTEVSSSAPSAMDQINRFLEMMGTWFGRGSRRKKQQCVAYFPAEASVMRYTMMVITTRLGMLIMRQKGGLLVLLSHCVDAAAQQEVMRGVARVLRVGLNLRSFHRLLPDAGKRGFGRTFRSPTLWEDMVKTITNCNMKWSGTVRMNMLLCKELGQGAFPTPKEVLAVSVDELKQRCKLGYRAERVRRLALAVEKREGVRTSDRLEGAPPGDKEAEDERSGQAGSKGVHYSRYAPYQFLAYWYELWKGYEARRGTISTRWVVCGDDLKGRSVLFDVSSKSSPPPSATPKKRKSPPQKKQQQQQQQQQASTPDGGTGEKGKTSVCVEGASGGRRRHRRRRLDSGRDAQQK
eukprot:jgi/Bigna1/72698/fgenesh1_pg.21_\